jgi:hypothetical protein
MRQSYNNDIDWSKVVIVILFLPALLISFVSAIHLYTWFGIGQSSILSGILAGAFELLSIGTFVIIGFLSILDPLAKKAVWVAIFVLLLLSVIGNVFSVFINLNTNLIVQASRLFGFNEGLQTERIISVLLGAILPITSVFFLKIGASYLEAKNRKDKEELKRPVGRPRKESY